MRKNIILKFVVLLILFLSVVVIGKGQNYNNNGQSKTYYPNNNEINYVYVMSDDLYIDVNINILRIRSGSNQEGFVFYGYSGENSIPSDWKVKINVNNNSNYSCVNNDCEGGRIKINSGFNQQILEVRANVVDGSGAVLINNTKIEYFLAPNFTVANDAYNSCLGVFEIEVNEITENKENSRPYKFELLDENRDILEEFTTDDYPKDYVFSGENENEFLIRNLEPGDYRYKITNNLGQTIEATFTVHEAYRPRANLIFAGFECADSEFGLVDIRVENGKTPIQWSLSNLETGNTVVSSSESGSFETYGLTTFIPNIAEGSYLFTFTDDNGCYGELEFDVLKPLPIEAELTNRSNVSCPGGSDGYLLFNARGGWTEPFEGNDFNPEFWGDEYNVTFYRNGQEFGALDEEIFFYTYPNGGEQEAWQIELFGVPAGEYYLEINEVFVDVNTDGRPRNYNCTQRFGPYIIEEPAEFLFNDSQTHIRCYGDESGEISIQPSGGTPGYEVTWYTGNFDNLSNPSGLEELEPTASKAAGETAAIANLPAGKYAVLVEDDNGCIFAENFEITQPDELLFDVEDVEHVECFGKNTGSLKVVLTGESKPPYTYSLVYTGLNGNPEEITHNTEDTEWMFSGLLAGNYEVLVTDANNCTESKEDVITILQPEKDFTVQSLAIDDVICFGEGNGEIQIQVEGGGGYQNLPGYTYQWYKDGTAFVFSEESTETHLKNLTPGRYHVVVTDEVDCVITSENFDIEEPAKLELVESIQPVSCFGGQDGAISLAVTGGVEAYNYVWSASDGGEIPAGQETSQNLSGLKKGKYSVQITDENMCLLDGEFIVGEPNQLLASLSYQEDVRCFGESSGEITVNIDQGSVGGYMVTLSGTDAEGQAVSSSSSITSSYTFNNLKAGNYEIKVDDGNGCPVEFKDVKILQPDAGLAIGEGEVFEVGNYNISCFEKSDGWIKPVVTGGEGDYEYQWTGPDGYSAGTLEITNLGPGTYNLVITDGNNCTATKTYTITEPEKLVVSGQLSEFDEYGIKCKGDSNGSITLDIQGGAYPFVYNWTTVDGELTSDQISQKDLSNLPAGTYRVEVTDANNCTEFGEYTLLEPKELLLEAAEPTDVDCKGKEEGAIKATIAQESVSPFTYILIQNGMEIKDDTNSQTSYSFTGLAAGNYSVKVVDGNGCEKVTPIVEILEPNNGVEFIKQESDGIKCYNEANGTISIEVAGGGGSSNNPTYSFEWTRDNEPFEVKLHSTDRELVGLEPGTYQVTVNDGFGCGITSKEFIIEQPSQLQVVGDPSDFNGFGVRKKGAADGSIDLTVSGGTPNYTYNWATLDGMIPSGMEEEKDLSGLIAGTYSVEILDGNNCRAEAEFTLEEPDELTLKTPVLHDIDCHGGSSGKIVVEIEKASVDPFTFILSGETYNGIPILQQKDGPELKVDFENLLAGEYQVIVRDANGVEVKLENLTIEHPASGMSLAAEDVKSITCFGYDNGSISITMSGGGGLENNPIYSYTWYKDGQVYNLQDEEDPEFLQNLSPGTYRFVVEDGHDCSFTSKEFEIFQPAQIEISGTPIHILCYGGENGAIALTAIGGTGDLEFAWSTEDGVLTEQQKTEENLDGLTAGTYIVIVTDKNGCTETASFTLTEPKELLLGESSLTPVLCKGQATGSFEAKIAQESVGEYTYRLFRDGIEQRSQKTSATSFKFENLVAGVYKVKVEDANGCPKETPELEILEPESGIVFTEDNSTSISCYGEADGTITIAVTGGGGPTNNPNYSYEWTKDGNPFTWSEESTATKLVGLEPGKYKVTVFDGAGCSIKSDDFTITQPDELLVTGVKSNYNGFEISRNGFSDGSIDLTVSGGTLQYTFIWTTEDGEIPVGTEEDEDLSGLIAGTYKVEIFDAEGCQTEEIFTLLAPDELKLKDAVLEPVNCFGEATGSILVEIEKASVAPFTYLLEGHSGRIEFTVPDLTYKFEGLEAGVYKVSVMDANGATEELLDLEIFQPDSGMEIINPNVIPVSCYGEGNGSISIEVTGGGGVNNEPTYTYTWYKNDQIYTLQAGDIDEALKNLSPGKYKVVVDDGHGCSFTSDIFEITQPDELQVSGTLSDYSDFGISCNGASDGSITLTVTGGTGPFDYEWTTTDGVIAESQKNQKDLTGLPAGTYTVEVKDKNECIKPAVFTLTQPEELLLDEPVLVDVMCKGDATGSFEARIAQESVGPYTYILYRNGAEYRNVNSADLNYTFEELSAGEYKVEVEDKNGCTKKTDQFEILEPEEGLEFILEVKTDILCSGDANGTISVEIKGGGGPENTPVYTFTWFSNGQPFTLNELSTDRELKGLEPGDYHVVVEDGFGCDIQSITFTIVQPDPLDIVDTISDYNGYEISCHGGSDGFIQLTISGGVGDYLYSWTTTDGEIPMGQEGSRNLTGIPAGTYTVVLTDGNDCDLSETYVLRDPEALILSEDKSLRQNIACFGDATGEIVVVAAGGNAPYQYIITGQTFEGLPYSFTSEFTQQNIFHFENLQAGEYQIELKDQNGCEISIENSIKITQPDAPLEIISEVISDYHGFNISCYGELDAFIHLEVAGGVGPYEYTWEGSDGFTASVLSLDELGPGDYSFKVVDKNGCEVTRDFTLIGPEPIEVETLQQNVLCGGERNGNVFILDSRGGTGNFQYVWIEDGVGEISRTFEPKDLRNVGPGKYALIVTDGSDCEFIEIFTITEPDPVVVELVGKVDNICFGEDNGSIEVNVTGGTGPYNYKWSGPNSFESLEANPSGLLAGEYLLEVVDALQCSQTLEVTIEEPEEIVVQETLTHISCFGENDGQILIEVSGGVGTYKYNWQGPDGFVSSTKNINKLYAGEYILTITDGIDCSIEKRYTVSEPALITLNPVISDYNGFAISCKGGSNGYIDLQITGGTGEYTIIWEGPNGFYSEQSKIEDLYPGEYEVFVKDENECWIRETFNLDEPDQLVIGEENLTPQQVSCFDGRDGSILVSLPNSSVAPYHFEIRGEFLNGMYHHEEINTSDTSHLFDGLRAGNYDVFVTDANGCHVTEVKDITIAQPDTALEAQVDVLDVQCYQANNGKLTVKATGGTEPYSILWNNGSEAWEMENLAPGTYSAVITDDNGCQTDVEAIIEEAPVFDLDPEVLDISCKGEIDGSIKLNIIGGISPVKVKWDHGPQTPDLYNLPSGIYKATIEDGSNCVIHQEFVINEPDQLQLTSSVTNALDCDNLNSGVITVTPMGGTPPFTFEWSNGGNEASVENLTPGQYSVKVIDARGCTVVDQYTIQRPDPLQVAVIQYNQKICEPRTVQTVFEAAISGGQPPYSIDWSRGQVSNGGHTMITEEEGLFTVMVTDDLGCEFTETFKVEIEDDITLDFEFNSASFAEVFEHLTNFEVSFKNNSSGEIKEFNWDFGDGNTSQLAEPVHRYQTKGTYVVTLSMKDMDGCMDVIQKEINITDYFLEVPNVFTPNGDGINDTFFPKFIHIRSLEFWVLNKWGEFIYYSDKLEDKGWDGTLNNVKAPTGNYVYKLKYTTLDGRELERSGPFLLAR